MIEALLLVQMALLWLLLRPKRDWYVVDHQIRYGKTSPSSPDGDFSKLHLSAHGLTIEKAFGSNAALSHKDGGKIVISQEVFSDLAAARQDFEYIKKLFPYGNEEDGSHKVYLRRIVARSREKAITLPPEQYYRKDGVVLEKFVSAWKPSENESDSA